MNGNRLFVGGLPWKMDDNDLREAFEPFGKVTDARVIMDRETGRSKGFGFVTYTNSADATEALAQMHDTVIDGRSIRVDEAAERPQGQGARRPPDAHRTGPGPERGGASVPRNTGGEHPPTVNRRRRNEDD